MAIRCVKICVCCLLLIVLHITLVETAFSLPAGSREQGASRFLSGITGSDELTQFLKTAVSDLLARNPWLKTENLQVSLIDLSRADHPRSAHINGEQRIYPASVVKCIYLIAAYRWMEEQKIELDAQWQLNLKKMIRFSDNQATRWVLYKLTGAGPGEALPHDKYIEFRENRLVVKHWLETLGIQNLHCVHPTYDGNGDLFGRDLQFLRDRSFANVTISQPGGFPNRLSVTALDIARLLSLLATGHLLNPENTKAVLDLMKRDVREQKYLELRIAGGAARIHGMQVYSKSGTYGETFADVGIVRAEDSRQLVLAVFIQRKKTHRIDFIAELTERCIRKLIGPALQ